MLPAQPQFTSLIDPGAGNCGSRPGNVSVLGRDGRSWEKGECRREGPRKTLSKRSSGKKLNDCVCLIRVVNRLPSPSLLGVTSLPCHLIIILHSSGSKPIQGTKEKEGTMRASLGNTLLIIISGIDPTYICRLYKSIIFFNQMTILTSCQQNNIRSQWFYQ